MIKAQDSLTAMGLRLCKHLSLTEQLDLGLRMLEIDVYYDPEGGRYSHPFGIEQQKKMGVAVQELDTVVMNKPGFKVMHVQGIDFRTNCATFAICLEEIKRWSKENPNHIPITISINAKDEALETIPNLTKPLAFTSTAFDALDKEIYNALPKKNIITPDQVRGEFKTLEDAVLHNNWPQLNEVLGTFMFVLDVGVTKREVYVKNHPSLKHRAMFITAPEGSAEAAIIFKNDPVKGSEDIKRLVKLGYIVRTRSDSETIEARTGDYSRAEVAFASGAQFVSTDYYVEDKRFNTGYKISLPDGKPVRCNPVNGVSDSCIKTLEN